jgi:segregation and condensation protein A
MEGGSNGHGKEKEILDMIPKENSWEQIMYEVVALEELDPWNLDIGKLARGFAEYIAGLEELDFRIPAKWVIIVALLLRMKSDQIKILKMDETPAAEDEFAGIEDFDDLPGETEVMSGEAGPELGPLEAVTKRKPVRKITINELVDSLRRVLKSQKRREMKIRTRKGKINISGEDIGKRINDLYARINAMLGRMDRKEIGFSELVGDWKRDNVVGSFLPLMHLDNEKKVTCRQNKMFEEIFIKRRDLPAADTKGS